MNAVTSSTPLRLQDTVEMSRVNHRLVMGVEWIDAPMQLPVGGDWVSDLERIGAREHRQRFDLHPRSRHALRNAGRLAKVLSRAAADKTAAEAAVAPLPLDVAADPTNFVLRAFARRDPRISDYSIDNDPRRYVPRRLSLTPVQTDGVPPSSIDNIRQAWLWPGSAYPLAANTTVIRGHVRRGATPVNVPWVRVVVTRTGVTAATFNTAPKLAWAHGDDRGEFLIMLGADAVPGGAVLPPSLSLSVWIFLPPAGVFDALDPLASLPLELAGSDALNDVLRGTAIPANYVQQTPVDVTLAPGRVFVMDQATLLFP